MDYSLNCIDDYIRLATSLDSIAFDLKKATLRYLFRHDLFFLIWFGFRRADIARPWLFDRCKEVENEPNNCLDLWSREHYKSTIITYGKTIQDILASHGDDPLPIWDGVEPTFGIFSCTRPLAKGFLRQIKHEFETNELLKNIFPDIIWEKPHRDAPKWSEDDGIILNRKSNAKESTVEAWGIVDGQPTSKHFTILIFDDVVTKESVSTPEMIHKVTESWGLSLNLGSAGGAQRYIGTRYHFNDTYKDIMSRQVAKPRIYPATIDGSPNGEPVFLSAETLRLKRQAMGPYIFACQMLMNPVADETQGFKRNWLRFYEQHSGDGLNKYIVVDPANSKKKSSDYTTMWVIGLGQDDNYYVIDIEHDRLNLTQRADLLFRLHRKWKPILTVGYEEYAMGIDTAHIQDKMNRENYHFNLVKLGGNKKKEDRIRSLIPLFEQGRIYLPYSIYKTDYEGKLHDHVEDFINNEYLAFPVCVHDDMLDSLSYILHQDMSLLFPISYEDKKRDYTPQTVNSLSPWSA